MLIDIAPKTKEAYKLMHDGILALSDIELNGIRIDIDYCKRQQKHLDRKIKRLQNKISNSKEMKEWRRIYRAKTNPDSNPQLADMLFNHFGLEPVAKTAKGKPAVDKASLEQLDFPLVKQILDVRKYKKARDTYIANLIRESVDGYMHPFFNLDKVRTFRSSSSAINFQNQPNRDPEIKKIIRSAFLPRNRHRLGGVDYGGIEVKIAATYHKDPVMLDYIHDPASDMHRDVTKDCFAIPDPDLVSKDMRKSGKNKFTFPEFYGDYFGNCARGLWSDAHGSSPILALTDQTPLPQHLKNIGLDTYEKFEEHIKEVERIFWEDRFTVYGQWKKDWLSKYNKCGYINLHTGFVCQGLMQKNDVINYPVQGAAFHCLLWSLIQIHNWLTKNKMRSLVVGQIHDEIVLDIHSDEFDDVMSYVKQVMTLDIREHWKWINVPLEVDADFCNVGETWYDKHSVVM